jgi:hypothetical protein
MRLVYLSPVPWASFAQRPHKFVEWFHERHEGEVLWIDPYPTRLPVLADLRRAISDVVAGSATLLAEIPRWLRVVRPRALPIEPLPGSGLLNRLLWRDVFAVANQFLAGRDSLLGAGKPSALALQLMSRNPQVPSFYDAMDDFPAFYQGLSRMAMAQRERALATRASKVLVSSTALAERFLSHSTKVCVALNACSVEALPALGSFSASADNPVLGYMGTIAHWFDWPLVIALASANPTMRIRLIGPMYCPPPRKIPNNIEIQPACDHAAAILAMQSFTAGLIPFQRTDLTASVDPIKYYEYRALGLPVISTSFGEMALREKQAGVFLIRNHSDLAGVVGRALAYQSKKNEIQQFRNENSWQSRFDESGIIP